MAAPGKAFRLLLFGVLGVVVLLHNIDAAEAPTREQVEAAFGHPLVGRRFRSAVEIDNCQILFVDRSESGRLGQILGTLSGRNTLTVSQTDKAAEQDTSGDCEFLKQLSEHVALACLVDDDPLLIKPLQDTLQEEGHLITVTAGGRAGINAFAAAVNCADGFDVVITDLGMPHVGGRKVASSVKALSATTPVIILTGLGQQLIAANDTPPRVDRVLAKPPRQHELRAALVEFGS